MPDWEREDLITNMIDLLGQCERQIQDRMVGLFAQCDPDYGARVADGLGIQSPVATAGVRQSGSASAGAVRREAKQSGVPPDPAEDVDQLHPVERACERARRVLAGPDGHGPVSLEQRRAGVRLRSGGQGCRDSPGQLLAAHRTERDERQARDQEGGLREDGRVRNLAREREGHRHRHVGVDDRADVRASAIDGSVDRHVRGGPWSAARRARSAGRLHERHDEEVFGTELVLAPTGRRDEDPIALEPDGQVPLGRRDEAACAEAATGGDKRGTQGRGLVGIHSPDRSPPEVLPVRCAIIGPWPDAS
jgi:hypothetical protein